MYSKKNNSRKILVVLLCVVMLIGGVIGGTLAYLVAQTNAVTNTFAVGNITISLAETVDTDPYKVVPGATQDKVPVVTVAAGSEKCYVYVCVENNLVIDGVVVAALDIDTDEWEEVATDGNKTIYCYHEVVDAATAKQELTVFTQVTYSTSITEANIDSLKDKTIIVDAYAHQAEHLETGVNTDNLAIAHFSSTSNP